VLIGGSLLLLGPELMAIEKPKDNMVLSHVIQKTFEEMSHVASSLLADCSECDVTERKEGD